MFLGCCTSIVNLAYLADVDLAGALRVLGGLGGVVLGLKFWKKSYSHLSVAYGPQMGESSYVTHLHSLHCSENRSAKLIRVAPVE